MMVEDYVAVIGRAEQEDSKQFKYSGFYEDIALAIRKNAYAWMVRYGKALRTCRIQLHLR